MKCKACGKEHPSHIRCEIWARTNAVTQDPMVEGRGVAPQGHQKDSKPSPVVAAPIKKVEEFLRKVGRPRKHADRKAYQTEWMRRKRASKREKVS